MISDEIDESVPLKCSSPAILPPRAVNAFLKPSHSPRLYCSVSSTSRKAFESFFCLRANDATTTPSVNTSSETV